MAKLGLLSHRTDKTLLLNPQSLEPLKLLPNALHKLVPLIVLRKVVPKTVLLVRLAQALLVPNLETTATPILVLILQPTTSKHLATLTLAPYPLTTSLSVAPPGALTGPRTGPEAIGASEALGLSLLLGKEIAGREALGPETLSEAEGAETLSEAVEALLFP